MSRREVIKRISLFMSREFLWAVFLFLAIILVSGTTLYLFGTPSVSNIADFPFKQTSILYDRTGTHELYRFFGEENRIVIPHEAIPDSLRNATIAAEDSNFYRHDGIDPVAVLRAIVVNVERGKVEQGASTITQQLARNLFLTRERSLDRKVREAILAVKIERNFNKDQILDLYLNAVPYGSNAYGVEAAAQTFFHKSAHELTLEESALLAALPNATTYYSPYGNHLEDLKWRQQDILQKMHTLGYISEEELSQARAIDVLAQVQPLSRPIVAPHFVFYTIDQLTPHFGREGLETKGLRITTSLDLDLQRAAEQAVKNGAARNASRHASNAALVALDPRSGEVLAMVGSRDYFDKSVDGNVNVVIQKRQPGSSFKPIVYATAFSKGFQPETPILDVPIDFGPDGSGKNYMPNNYDGRYHGMLTMRQALAMSLNIPAVQTLALAGIPDTVAMAEKLGITSLSDPEHYGLALGIGAGEVKPIEMANAFSTFSQDGMHYPVNPITQIVDAHGQEIYHFTPEGSQVLDQNVARKINSVLSDNNARAPTFGSHSPLAFPAGVQVAAKTGTTQDFHDAWTVGYTAQVAVAVWTGNNDNKPMTVGSDGIFVAAPIWRDFMNTALKTYPQTGFAPYQKAETLPQLAKVDFAKTKTIYISKKDGKEISKKKAEKKSPGEVDVVTVLAPKKGDDDDDDTKFSSKRRSINDIKALYRNYYGT